MCLDRVTKLYSGRYKLQLGRQRILCIKEIDTGRSIRGKIHSYYRNTPLKIGKWMTDTVKGLVTSDMNSPAYETGYHAYKANKKNIRLLAYNYRLVLLTNITAIGNQFGSEVIVGRRMFVVPRKEENKTIERWNRYHPKEKISR